MKNLLKDVVVLDLETTGLDFATCEIIELSSMTLEDALTTQKGGIVVGHDFSDVLYKPHKPIEPEVSAINGITNRMVERCRHFEEDSQAVADYLQKHKYMVAHNAFYDANVLKANNIAYPKVICTLRMARKLYDGDNTVKQHTLSYLRYRLDLPIDDQIIAHRASDDVLVTSALFIYMLQEAVERGCISAEGDLGEELVAWLDEPVITSIMPFGKHKDKKMSEIPISYWQWAVENMDSLKEGSPYYDPDWAASVAVAVDAIFNKD